MLSGLAHLEALEMLSNTSEKKVSSLLNALPPEIISKVKPQLLEIKENFEINDEDEEVEEQDFVKLVTDLFQSLSLGNTPAKLTSVRKLTNHWHSSHYVVMHLRNKNSNIQGRSPYVVKVTFHVIRNCS